MMQVHSESNVYVCVMSFSKDIEMLCAYFAVVLADDKKKDGKESGRCGRQRGVTVECVYNIKILEEM